MGNEATITVVIVVLVLSMLVGIYMAFNSGKKKDKDLSQDEINNALKNFKFSNVEALTFDRPTTSDTPFEFVKYVDFTVGDFANFGAKITGKTLDDCTSLCSSTSGCRGYVYNNGCQLKNNVAILERSKGSNIYASGDIGGVRYLKMPYSPIISPGSEPLWSITGQLGDAVANCYTNKQTCAGFVTGVPDNTYKMYGESSIVGIDSQNSGATYVSPNNPVSFIKEGNYKYLETPSDTWDMNRSWTFPYENGRVKLPTNDTDYFTIWNNGWDAGADGSNAANAANAIIVVNDLAQCQNACVTNTWCQSFVYSNTNKSCHLRKNTKAQHFAARCRSQRSADICSDMVAGCNCPCGCEGEYPASDGISDSSKISYVKKQFPLEISCPVSCGDDVDCKMVTFDDTKCNKYYSIPVKRAPDTKYTSVWNINNFPR